MEKPDPNRSPRVHYTQTSPDGASTGRTELHSHIHVSRDYQWALIWQYTEGRMCQYAVPFHIAGKPGPPPRDFRPWL